MLIAQDNPTKRRGIAFTATVLFHGLLILMFILWKLITPIPPFPEAGGGGGMTVDLGYSDVGQDVHGRPAGSVLGRFSRRPTYPIRSSSSAWPDVELSAAQVRDRFV